MKMNLATSSSKNAIILMMAVLSSSIWNCSGYDYYCETNQGFLFSGDLNFDGKPSDNTQIIGAHLHTGNTTTNGPVNIAFCGGPQLPGVLNFNGACNLTEASTSASNERFTAKLDVSMSSCYVDKAFTDGANKATSVPGEALVEAGAPTSLKIFLKELASCDDSLCNVYFNIHTNYSFDLNPGAYGVARGQLRPTSCPESLLSISSTAKCFTASVSSENTNIVTGIPNQFPPHTAAVTNALSKDVLVMYAGGLAPGTLGRRERRLQAVGDGFAVYGNINFDASLSGNTEIIGAHLHTGSKTTNGPVNIAFCGSAPLPGLLNANGACSLTNERTVDGRFLARIDSVMPNSLANEIYTNGANKVTSVPGATSLADGAPTTLASFLEELKTCDGLGPCDVYFNIHTKYSFETNAGAYGLARGQLERVACESEVLPEGYTMESARCYYASVQSEHTNLVDDIPNQLPYNAGGVKPIIGDAFIVYEGGAFPPLTLPPIPALTPVPTAAPTAAPTKRAKKTKKNRRE